MNDYELKIYDEVTDWKFKITKRSGMVNRFSKKLRENKRIDSGESSSGRHREHQSNGKNNVIWFSNNYE